MTRLLTIREAAERLAVKPRTIRAWLAEKRLAQVKLGDAPRSAVRIEESEIERYVDAHRLPAWGRPTRKQPPTRRTV